MYVIGGFELIIPVHAIVRMFEAHLLPQLTITVGRGARSGPTVDFTFIVSLPPDRVYCTPFSVCQHLYYIKARIFYGLFYNIFFYIQYS